MNGARASGNIFIASIGIIDIKTIVVANGGTYAIFGCAITSISLIVC